MKIIEHGKNAFGRGGEMALVRWVACKGIKKAGQGRERY